VSVVDDDEQLRTALCRLLRASGHTTQVYYSAGAFLQGADLENGPGFGLAF